MDELVYGSVMLWCEQTTSEELDKKLKKLLEEGEN
jgi:hypothetical protein